MPWELLIVALAVLGVIGGALWFSRRQARTQAKLGSARLAGSR